MKDPYQILGVSKTATQEEIKKAYRSLVKKNHPDLNPGNKQAEARFKEISVAYDLIGTPEERAKFDRGETQESFYGSQGNRGGDRSSYYNTQQNAGRYSHSFADQFGDEDLFEELFRQVRGQGRSTKPTGQDTLYKMEVSLKDAVTGVEKIINLPNGTNLKVKIPPGINSGTKLRFKGHGEKGPGGKTSGDALIEVTVVPTEGFVRTGNDIETEVPISFIEALTGAEISVPTLYGPVMLKIPPGVSTGTKLRIKGKGVQTAESSGSQIVKIKIVMPKVVPPELVAEASKWKEKYNYNPR